MKRSHLRRNCIVPKKIICIPESESESEYESVTSSSSGDSDTEWENTESSKSYTSEDGSDSSIEEESDPIESEDSASEIFADIENVPAAVPQIVSNENSEEYSSEDEGDFEVEVEIEAVEVEIQNEEEGLTAQDRDLKKRFHHDLCERNKRYNQMQQVNSLQSLCVTTVVKNLYYFCRLHSPFQGLPGLILKLLKDEIVKIPENILNVELQYILITDHTTDIELNFTCNNLLYITPSLWNRRHNNKLLKLISEKCENKLRFLTLKLHNMKSPVGGRGWIPPQPTLEQVNHIVANQMNLQELTISACNIDNKTLEIIGSVCEHLRYLNVSHNEKITDRGIQYLCSEPNPVGKCLKLEKLNVKKTRVGVCGIIVAISNLPLLEELSVDDEDLICLSLMYVDKEKHKISPIKLRSIMFCDNLVPNVQERIGNLIPQMSNLKHLTTVWDDLTPFHVLKKVTYCHLQTNATSIQISNLLIHIGTNLSQLLLVLCDAVIDVSIIAIHCPNIEVILIDKCSVSTSCEYDIDMEDTSCFTKLKHFQLSNCNNNDLILPDIVITQILSCKLLAGYYAMENTVPSHIIKSLLMKARQENEIFSNLERIMLKPGILDDINMWIELICAAPKLYEIDFCDSLGSGELMMIKKFVERNELNIGLNNHFMPVSDYNE